MVFFPSYQYMNEILGLWQEQGEELGKQGFGLLVPTKSSRFSQGNGLLTYTA